MTTRRQLTLFVPEPYATRLEQWRSVLDPVQAKMIAAHVTLCRDDELENIAPILERLRDLQSLSDVGVLPLDLEFGVARRSEAHGILMPCVAGEDRFNRLRSMLLGTDETRTMHAHITLAHPRNPCTEVNSKLDFSALPRDFGIRFEYIAWIEQQPQKAWETIEVFRFSK